MSLIYHILCCSNPSLRVAYIDEVEEREGGKVHKVFYSVLIKAVENLDQVIFLWLEILTDYCVLLIKKLIDF